MLILLAGGEEGSGPVFDALVESSFFARKKNLIPTPAGGGGGGSVLVFDVESSCFVTKIFLL
jgi:hypothetical protein